MDSQKSLAHEVQRQVDLYVQQGYPALAGLDEAAFRALAQPLVDVADTLDVPAGDSDAAATGRVPVVLVVTRTLVDDEARVPVLRLVGSDKPGILDANHASDALVGLVHYHPRAGLEVPRQPMYLLVGVERGDEYRDVAPREALDQVTGRDRTPLTIDEGLSLATLAPEILAKNHCFSLAGSTRGDKRVPALWISDKAPKLGWCFEGVPHSWLGLASARERVVVPNAAADAVVASAAENLTGHDPSAWNG